VKGKKKDMGKERKKGDQMIAKSRKKTDPSYMLAPLDSNFLKSEQKKGGEKRGKKFIKTTKKEKGEKTITSTGVVIHVHLFPPHM